MKDHRFGAGGTSPYTDKADIWINSGLFDAPGIAGLGSIEVPGRLAAAASAQNPVYIENTLPTAVAAASGHQVSLSSILTATFGAGFGGYKDFWISYYGAPQLQKWDYSYWDPSHAKVAQWLVNGHDIGASTANSYNSVHVSAADAASCDLKAGNDIGDLAYITVATAYDSSGNATAYDELSVIAVVPSLIASNAGNGAPKPSDIVASAKHFSQLYSGVPNDNDCHKIACALSAAAGAAFTDDTTYSLKPAQNESGGFWRVVYRGSDPHPVAHWQTLVKAGDIVRMGWKVGGQHTTTVLAVNHDGSIKVFDNDKFVNKVEEIGTHDANYDTQTIAKTITIYRLSPDHLYLINGSSAGELLAGTKFSDQILGDNGNDTLSGYVGNDQLNGGAGADKLNGGAGHDTFVYTGVSQSTGATHDTIAGFSAKQDDFNLNVTVHAINGALTHGTLSKAHFSADLQTAIGSHLKAHDAILFTADGGNENGHTFLVVDANGQAGYQSGHDYVFELTGAVGLAQLSAHDFT